MPSDSQEMQTRKRRLKRLARRKGEQFPVANKLVMLSKQIKKHPSNAQMFDLLTVYATDELLTAGARLEQAKMKRRTAWLYVIGIVIIIGFAFAAATVLTAGTGLSMAIILTVVMVSKIEGIIALVTTMKATNEGACRQVFKDVDAVQSNLEKKHSLTRFQQFVLSIKRQRDNAAVSLDVKPQDIFKESAVKVLKSVAENLDASLACISQVTCPQRPQIRQEIKTNFANIIAETKKLIQQTNTTASQDQMAWAELLPYLISVSKQPLDLEALVKLEEKLSEVSLAADARIRQDYAQTFAKIILFTSLVITVACIIAIFVAMMWFGATVTSPIVLFADALITLSKGIFWLGGVPATAIGSVDAKRYQKKKSETSHVQLDISESKLDDSQSPLKKISFFANNICASVRKAQLVSDIPVTPQNAICHPEPSSLSA